MRKFWKWFLGILGPVSVIWLVICAAEPEKHVGWLMGYGVLIVLALLAMLIIGIAVTVKPPNKHKKGRS